MTDTTNSDVPPSAASAAASTLTQRLDRLAFTRAHAHVVTSSGIGWALDALDVALISYVIVVLKSEWSLSSTEQSWIVSLGFIGMALGAMLGGRLADRFGRRTVFALTLLIFGLGAALSAFAPVLAFFLVMRFIVGLGLGAELPVASTYVSEFAPPSIRGRIIVVLEAFWAIGWLLAALLGYLLVPHGDWGWRIAMLIGAVPALYAAFVRFGLPESIRFLEAHGRHDEAEQIVRRFEKSPVMFRVQAAGAAATRPSTSAEGADSAESRTATSGFGGLWRPGQVRNTVALSVVWFLVNFSYYGAFIWIPSILAAQGHDLVKSFGYTLIITLAQLPGYAVAAWLIEHWGRRWTLASFLIGSAVSAVFFGTAGSVTAILVSGCLLSFFNLGAWGALYAISPEVFPTALRGTGTGWSAGFGRVASIIAPLLVPVVLAAAWGGTGVLFSIFGVAFVLAALSALLLDEHMGQVLTD
ncbi:MFS transporter [Pseudoclavibacter sp. CFCC 14310]|uniref:MFS transporter n=1 Tax=Pseudoclavibacter sp. CFCC 14310 TaxID=2615180 RepID=UPI001300CAC1|nr:MFS transporter [Pseudoclavibacter sp. CFCC 14310]KAB1646310.1 MFS transporter [Pseudoclavibacter sp. CFCC 14310]